MHAFGVRRLLCLIRKMPSDSALVRAMHGGKAPDEWSNVHELLATNVEVTDAVFRVLFATNVKKGTKMPEPIRILRPDRTGGTARPLPPRKQSSKEAIARFFARGPRKG